MAKSSISTKQKLYETHFRNFEYTILIKNIKDPTNINILYLDSNKNIMMATIMVKNYNIDFFIRMNL